MLTSVSTCSRNDFPTTPLTDDDNDDEWPGLNLNPQPAATAQRSRRASRTDTSLCDQQVVDAAQRELATALKFMFADTEEKWLTREDKMS